MSRRSSVSSTGSVSTSAKSGVEDDPMMKDCYDLRRRLLQTEQSLQNMKPPTLIPSDKSRTSHRSQPSSYERKKGSAEKERERGYHLSPDDLRMNKRHNYHVLDSVQQAEPSLALQQTNNRHSSKAFRKEVLLGDEYKKQDDKRSLRYYASSGTLSDYSSYSCGVEDQRPDALRSGVQEAKDSYLGTLVDKQHDLPSESRNYKEIQVTPPVRQQLPAHEVTPGTSRKSCLVQRRDSSYENTSKDKKSKSIHFSPETPNQGPPIDKSPGRDMIPFVGLKETPEFESTRKTLFTQQRKLDGFFVDSPLKLSDLGVHSFEQGQVESLKTGSIGEYIERRDGAIKKFEMEQGICESPFHLQYQTEPHSNKDYVYDIHEECSQGCGHFGGGSAPHRNLKATEKWSPTRKMDNSVNKINKDCSHRCTLFGKGAAIHVPPPRNLEATEKWTLKRKNKSLDDSLPLSFDSKIRELEEERRKNSLDSVSHLVTQPRTGSRKPLLSSSEPRRRRLPETPDASAQIDSVTKDRQSLGYSVDQSSEELFNKSLEVLGKSKVCQISPRDYSINTPSRSYSSSPESAQILTLADLTPPASDPGMSHNRRGNTPLLGTSFKSSLPDLRNGSALSTPRDREMDNRSFSSDYDHDTLRKKLNKHREENAQLVSQNHKLMSELEHLSFELHQAKNKNKIISHDLEEERKRVQSLEDRIVSLESQLADQEDRARMNEHNFKECQEELHSKTEELRSVLETSNIAETELREEAKLRKRAEIQLQDAMRSVDELSEKLADQEESIRMLKKQSADKEKSLRDRLSQSQKEYNESYEKRSAVEAQLQELKEEIRLLQDEGIIREDTQASLQQENTCLRATISRQSQKIGRLENELRKTEYHVKGQGDDLQDVVERQQQRILQYQQEMEETKHHMARLEDLVHRVQEQSMKEHVNATPSTSDSGIFNSHQRVNGYSNSSPGSDGSYLNGDILMDGDGHTPSSPGKTRALVADLKLKLAMKEAEIQKLQASAVARAAAQQKHIAGLSSDGGTMDGLRSELSAIVERSRMGDRKQHELEQLVTRLEDEISRYSSQNIQLEERLADKMSHIASLEGKLGQRNLRIVDIQKNLEEKVSEVNDLLRELRQKEAQINQLERQLDGKFSEQSQRADQVKEIKDELRAKINKIGELEEALRGKNSELQDAATLIEKMKTLHAEHCKELQEQLEQIQKKLEDKSVVVIQLETELAGTRQQFQLRNSIAEQLERNLKEQAEKLEKSEQQSELHNQKFCEMESQAQDATKQMKHLKESLAECQREIKVYLQQLEEARKEHEDEINGANNEITKLRNALQQASTEVEQKTNYIEKLEKAVTDRQASLEREQERCRELQESRIHLQQQVSLIEEEIHRERNTTQQESLETQHKLHKTESDLETRTKEVNELSSTLKEIHQDMKESSGRMIELEQLLQESRSHYDKKSAQLQTIELGYKESRSQLTQQTKRNGELEERIRHLENELKDKDEQVAQLDKEVNKIEGDLQDTISQLKSLEDLLQTSQHVVEEKEKKVSELDKMLNESVDELQQKEKDIKEKESQIAELDQALKESQKEIKTKDTQVSQLDMTMKEHRSELQQKVVTLEHSLNQARYELSERAVEIAELKAKLDQTQDSLRQKKTRLEHYEKTAKQQQMDMKKRLAQIGDLTKEAEKLRKRKQETDEISQELRLSREQLQNTHAELMEARRDLLKYQRREQELIQELDEAHTLLTAKEHDCTRLAKDLGSAQVREAEAEARCVQEMRKTQQQHEMKQVSQEQEVKRLQESHAKMLSQREEMQAEKRLLVNNLQENERHLSQELANSKEEMKNLIEENRHLASQLNVYQDDLKAINEALVIKDAEIARLEARISGYERAMFGTRPHFDRLGAISPRPSPRSHPSHGSHVRRVTSPRSLADNTHSGLTKSISDHNLHNLSESSVFSLLDNDDIFDSRDNIIPERGAPNNMHMRSRTFDNRSHAVSHNRPTGIEILDNILESDKVPLIMTPTRTDRTHAKSMNSTSSSPPQRQEAKRPLNDDSTKQQTLKEQLENKKKESGMIENGVDGDLDPVQCRASLEERLRASEERRKQIDKQLHTMQSTMT